MESNSFIITVNNINYTVRLNTAIPELYDVSSGTAYHRIGKTDAGQWVYVEAPLLVQHMPLQEIGSSIEEYLELTDF